MKEKNEKKNKWKDFFLVLFLIAKEFNHLHKAMGWGNTSPWQKQHNKLIITTLGTR